MALEAWHAVTFDSEFTFPLGASRNFHFYGTGECRNLDLTTEGRGDKRNGDLAVKFGAFPRKDGVLQNMDYHIEITIA